MMENEPQEKSWSAVNRVNRRVMGVLVEKAKTTPDAYPMTINAIVTAANQKSNRHPQMQLTPDDVDESLEDLRKQGAVSEIQGDGRKPKFRHLLYEWLGVDKVEIAIMAELLLRGQQTVGELRARASRMEKIEGLAELKPILQELIQKGLVIELTPSGRGQLVTHNLYLPEELAKIERSMESVGVVGAEPSIAAPAASSDGDTIQRLEESLALLTARVQTLEKLVLDEQSSESTE
ncbi:MAG: DUF480 domain-containing protein [Planctomycetota bacterium]